MLVGVVLARPLVVDVGQEIRVVEVVLVVVGVAVVLRGHDVALDVVGPHGAALEQGVGGVAHKVRGALALLEGGNAVVLAAEGEQAADGRVVAALDVAAQELAALGEADGVDGGRGGQYGVGEERGADGVDLFGDVAEERGAAVVGGTGGGYEVDVGAWVDFFDEVGRGLQAFGVGGIAEAVPEDYRDRSIIVVVVVGWFLGLFGWWCATGVVSDYGQWR